MKISFDPKYGVLYLKFSEDKIANTVESDGGVLIDYGDSGQIIGIEINQSIRLIKAHPRNFSDLCDELGEPEAKEDIDSVLGSMRERSYYEESSP